MFCPCVTSQLQYVCIGLFCFSEILEIYKSCKKIDSALRTSHFEDPKLRRKISSIREEWKREKSDMLTNKVKVDHKCYYNNTPEIVIKK